MSKQARAGTTGWRLPASALGRILAGLALAYGALAVTAGNGALAQAGGGVRDSAAAAGTVRGLKASGKSSSDCVAWTGTQPTPQADYTSPTELDAVATVSPCDAWAVGTFTNDQPEAIIQHWNGADWQAPAYFNEGLDSDLRGVAAVSAKNVWAVGYREVDAGLQTLVMHWNGNAWRVVPCPHSGFLTGVAAVSARDIWAVGYAPAGDVNGAVILHWNGISWKEIVSPSSAFPSALFAVAAVSAGNVWAVGDDYSSTSRPSRTLIEHWNGKKWARVPSPTPGAGNDHLYGVAAVSASSAWAVGVDYSTSSGVGVARTLIEHWTGKKWAREASPTYDTGGILNAVTAVSAGNVWAVGSSAGTLVLHWNGGAWRQVASPDPGTDNVLNAVDAKSARDMWAVGSYLPVSGPPAQQTVPLAIHCC